MKNLDATTIPDELKRRMIVVGKIEWGAVGNKTDEQHLADFADTLRITREHFQLEPGNHALNGCYQTGTETVVCHTGTSPNSAEHAKIIAGLWNSVIDAMKSEQRVAHGDDRICNCKAQRIEAPGLDHETSCPMNRAPGVYPHSAIVDNAMISRALAGFDTGRGDPNDYRRRMKFALEAALQ